MRKRVGVAACCGAGVCPSGVGAGRIGTEFIDAALLLVRATHLPRLKDSLTESLLLNAVFSHIVMFFLLSQCF